MRSGRRTNPHRKTTPQPGSQRQPAKLDLTKTIAALRRPGRSSPKVWRQPSPRRAIETRIPAPTLAPAASRRNRAERARPYPRQPQEPRRPRPQTVSDSLGRLDALGVRKAGAVATSWRGGWSTRRSIRWCRACSSTVSGSTTSARESSGRPTTSARWVKSRATRLLDWLACKLVESGWSIKAMHRLMLTSSTYRMSSLPEAAEQVDPTNALLHRMNVRRLEAESIRDSLLAVSGQLEPAMYGPSVPVHLTSYMEGRGRPGQSGPARRRRPAKHLSECQAKFPEPDVSGVRCARAVFDDGPAQRLECPRTGVHPHE